MTLIFKHKSNIFQQFSLSLHPTLLLGLNCSYKTAYANTGTTFRSWERKVLGTESL